MVFVDFGPRSFNQELGCDGVHLEVGMVTVKAEPYLDMPVKSTDQDSRLTKIHKLKDEQHINW
jgi:hypothetical protein